MEASALALFLALSLWIAHLKDMYLLPTVSTSLHLHPFYVLFIPFPDYFIISSFILPLNKNNQLTTKSLLFLTTHT